MTDPAATARAELAAIAAERGHAVDLARRYAERLERAFADGALRRTPVLDAMLADLAVALERDAASGKHGGKSGEAARLILRALARAIDAA
ncbi:MAG: hypothetical protein RL338_1412 [Chloroflexota bacterium]